MIFLGFESPLNIQYGFIDSEDNYGESVIFNYTFEQGKLKINISNQKAGVYLLKIQINQIFYQVKLNKL